jgi:hypothetical protein
MTRYAVEYRVPSYKPEYQWVLSDTFETHAEATRRVSGLRQSMQAYDVGDAEIRVRKISA